MEDNSLDEELTKLQSVVRYGAHSPGGDGGGEIDELIRDMDSMISEYEAILRSFSNIKGAEEEAVPYSYCNYADEPQRESSFFGPFGCMNSKQRRAGKCYLRNMERLARDSIWPVLTVYAGCGQYSLGDFLTTSNRYGS